MKLSLFDLHCDTAYEMKRQNQPLDCNKLAVSLQNAAKFARYTQVMALWTDHNLTDEEGWDAAMEMLTNLQRDAAITEGRARIWSHDPSDHAHAPTLLLSIEDARILNNRIERVDELYRLGVRILTPLWKGLTSIGGSHDTDAGLTDFGRTAITRAVALGMIPDVSHASEQAANDIFEIAAAQGRPVMASHSNAYEICPVSRNLRSGQIKAILNADGVIGLNLHEPFLTTEPHATINDILRHVDYFLTQGAENALCLGCDMDGCRLPAEVPSLAALWHLAERMQQFGYPDTLIQKIFFENATRFATTYIFV